MSKSRIHSPWYVVVLYAELLLFLILAMAAGPIVYLVHLGPVLKAPQNGREVQILIGAILFPIGFGYMSFKVGVCLREILGMSSAENVQLPRIKKGQRVQAVAIGIVFIVGPTLWPIFVWGLGHFQLFLMLLAPSVLGVVFGVCLIIWAVSEILADRRELTNRPRIAKHDEVD